MVPTANPNIVIESPGMSASAPASMSSTATMRALGELMRAEIRDPSDAERVIADVVELAARTLRVERVGVWRLDDDASAIDLVDMVEATTRRHSHGLLLRSSDAPRYFDAVMRERSIAAADARTDTRNRGICGGRPTDGGAVPNGRASAGSWLSAGHSRPREKFAEIAPARATRALLPGAAWAVRPRGATRTELRGERKR